MNANNRIGRLRMLVAEHTDRGQASGWDANRRQRGWRPTKRTSVPPAKSIKGRRSAKGSGGGGRGGRH